MRLYTGVKTIKSTPPTHTHTRTHSMTKRTSSSGKLENQIWITITDQILEKDWVSMENTGDDYQGWKLPENRLSWLLWCHSCPSLASPPPSSSSPPWRYELTVVSPFIPGAQQWKASMCNRLCNQCPTHVLLLWTPLRWNKLNSEKIKIYRMFCIINFDDVMTHCNALMIKTILMKIISFDEKCFLLSWKEAPDLTLSSDFLLHCFCTFLKCCRI